MKRFTWLLSLASIMMPMTLSAQVAYTWDFESEDQLNEWTIVDKDGDGSCWEYENEGQAHGGKGMVKSASLNNANGEPLTPDNWLISPKVNLGPFLSFWAWGESASGYYEVFGVYVCVGNSTSPDDFVQVGSDITTIHDMNIFMFDLSEYAGKEGRIAIRHYNCTDMYYLNIDDICFSNIPIPNIPANITVTPEATTANVTWDDAESVSWNLRYREIYPNEAQSFLWDLTPNNYASQIEGWGVEDRDGDGLQWALVYGGYDPTDQLSYYDNACFYSYSYYNSEVYDPDNWLYTPVLTLGGTFKFYAYNKMAEYPDVLGVYVVTEDGEYQIGEDIIPPAGVWTEYTFDTSAYNGKVGPIAIVHHNSYDRLMVYVDYISYVKEGVEPAEPIEINALTEPSYTIPGLKPNTEYVVEVQAYNEMGETDWTPVTHFTTTNSSIATGLNQVTSDKSQVTSNEWYTLDGRKLNGKPAAKGIYIQNGKKTGVK